MAGRGRRSRKVVTLRGGNHGLADILIPGPRTMGANATGGLSEVAYGMCNSLVEALSKNP